jgi:hypothetical protein
VINPKKLDTVKVALTVVVTIVVVSGVLFGMKLFRGDEPASAADCALAQQLFGEAAQIPAVDATAQKWEAQARKVAEARLADEDLRTEFLAYVHWARVKATGAGDKPGAGVVDGVIGRAAGRCDDLRIQKISF